YETERLIRSGVAAGFDDARLAITALDLVLEQHQRVEHALGSRGTPRYVDVGGDDLVDARAAGVVVVEAAARSARAEREHPLRLCHLLVDALQHGGLALGDGTHHPEQVTLTRRKARSFGAEAREVVARAGDAHELHPATRRHEGI